MLRREGSRATGLVEEKMAWLWGMEVADHGP